MRTAAGWAVIGLMLAGAVTAGAFDKVAPQPAPPAAAPAAALPVAPPAASPPAAEPPSDPAVVALIAKLGDPNYREREKAGAALEARGEKALPDLRRALNTTENPEVARRLTVLVRKIDHDRLVSPRRVTLTVKDKSAKEILEEIGKQTGYRIDYQAGGRPEGKYTFEFANTPFWEAVDRVANASGLAVYADYDDEIVRVNSYSDSLNPHVCYAGPFRFVAQSISASKSVQLANVSRSGFGARPNEYINLSFQIQSEPKNPILGTTQAELITATDETGSSLVPPRDQNNAYRVGYYNPGYRGHNASGGVNLARGSKDATTIKALKGKIGVVMLAGVVPEVVVDDPLKAKNQKQVGRTVEVHFDSMTDGGANYTVTLTLKKLSVEDPDRYDYTWSNSAWQKVELIDDKGNRFRTYGPSNTNNTGHSVTMTIQFGPEGRGANKPVKFGKPVRLVVNEWISVTHEVTFEFKNIPLP